MHICNSNCTHSRALSRRDFLTTASLAAMAIGLPSVVRAQAPAPKGRGPAADAPTDVAPAAGGPTHPLKIA